MLADLAPEDRASVEVLARVSLAEQTALFNRASIFLFPSLSEGVGLALVEAMCFGLAAVSGATGFAADFLQDGREVKLCAPPSEHVARATLALIDDPGQRMAIAEQGKALARSFTISRMADDYEQVFMGRNPARSSR